jgi:hypothetical protein
MARPSAMRSAASKLSARRCACRAHRRRSMTTSMSCFSAFFSLGSASASTHRAADAKAHVAARLHVGEQLGELALAVAHHRRQHHQPRVFGQRQHGVDHLAHALRLQRQVVVGAVGRAGARVQQAQVVVDLGDRADRAARVVAGGLLLDADGRATGPRSRRHRACPSAAGTAARRPTGSPRSGAGPRRTACRRPGCSCPARQAGDHHQRVLGDVEVDVLQVVRARAAHPQHAQDLAP